MCPIWDIPLRRCFISLKGTSHSTKSQFFVGSSPFHSACFVKDLICLRLNWIPFFSSFSFIFFLFLFLFSFYFFLFQSRTSHLNQVIDLSNIFLLWKMESELSRSFRDTNQFLISFSFHIRDYEILLGIALWFKVSF